MLPFFHFEGPYPPIIQAIIGPLYLRELDLRHAIVAGEDPNTRIRVSATRRGMTPLIILAFRSLSTRARGYWYRCIVRCVAMLIEASATLDLKDAEGVTALMYAACHKASQISALLLAAGAKVNRQSKQGMTALHYAAEYGSVANTILLISAGAVVDVGVLFLLKTPLGSAIQRHGELDASDRHRRSRVYPFLIRAGARTPPKPPRVLRIYLRQVATAGGFHAHALAHRERLRATFVPKLHHLLPKYLVYRVLDYWAHFGCCYTVYPEAEKTRRKKKNAKSKSKKKGRNFSKL